MFNNFIHYRELILFPTDRTVSFSFSRKLIKIERIKTNFEFVQMYKGETFYIDSERPTMYKDIMIETPQTSSCTAKKCFIVSAFIVLLSIIVSNSMLVAFIFMTRAPVKNNEPEYITGYIVHGLNETNYWSSINTTFHKVALPRKDETWQVALYSLSLAGQYIPWFYYQDVGAVGIIANGTLYETKLEYKSAGVNDVNKGIYHVKQISDMINSAIVKVVQKLPVKPLVTPYFFFDTSDQKFKIILGTEFDDTTGQFKFGVNRYLNPILFGYFAGYVRYSYQFKTSGINSDYFTEIVSSPDSNNLLTNESSVDNFVRGNGNKRLITAAHVSDAFHQVQGLRAKISIMKNEELLSDTKESSSIDMLFSGDVDKNKWIYNASPIKFHQLIQSQDNSLHFELYSLDSQGIQRNIFLPPGYMIAFKLVLNKLN